MDISSEETNQNTVTILPNVTPKLLSNLEIKNEDGANIPLIPSFNKSTKNYNIETEDDYIYIYSKVNNNNLKVQVDNYETEYKDGQYITKINVDKNKIVYIKVKESDSVYSTYIIKIFKKNTSVTEKKIENPKTGIVSLFFTITLLVISVFLFIKAKNTNYFRKI